MTEAIQQISTEKNMFWTLVGVIFLCAGFYMYSINATIRNVVTRQNIESKISELSVSIGNNEFAYIGLRNNITLAVAYEMGFKDVENKTFISKNNAKLVTYLSN